MFHNLRLFSRLASQIVKNCEVQQTLHNEKLLKAVKCGFSCADCPKNFHTNLPRMKDYVSMSLRVEKLRHLKEDQGSKGESLSEYDIYIKRQDDMFPTVDLPDRLFDGIPFKDLPIVHIKTTRNNTIASLIDNKGATKLIRSCGVEGFKNTRKGTNIAAHTTGVSFGVRAVKKGYKTVKAVIKGLGPGRMSVLQGLQLGGLNIVSLTDATVVRKGQRPKKARRL